MGKFLDNLVSSFIGIPNKYKSTVSPTFIASEYPSFEYDGKITQIENTIDETIKVVDNTIIIRGPRDEKRKEAQSNLNQVYYLSYLEGILGVLGSAHYVSQANQTKDSLNLVGLACCVLATVNSFYRAEQANSEHKKWKDPTSDICKKRQTYSCDVKKVLDDKMKGSIFAEKEIKDIYFRTQEKIENTHDAAMRSGLPKCVIQSIDSFYYGSPSSYQIVNTVFPGDEPNIVNPNPSDKNIYRREGLKDALNKFELFSKAYISSQQDYKIKLENMRRIEMNVQAGIHVVGKINQELLKEQQNEQKVSAESLEEHAQILRKYKKKKEFNSALQNAMHNSIFFYSQNKEDILKHNHQKEMIDKLLPFKEDVLQAFRSAKI